jgi:hypothetical protein
MHRTCNISAEDEKFIQNISSGNLEGKEKFVQRDTDRAIIFKWILGMQDVKEWTVFTAFMKDSVAGYHTYCYEFSGFRKK